MPPSVFKVIMIGDLGVGKSSIVRRIQFQQFEENYQPKPGLADFHYRTVFEEKEIELQIWDANMEHILTLFPAHIIYYRGAKAVILVYDQTNLNSSKDFSLWLQDFREQVNTPVYFAIAANKDDLPNKTVNNQKIKSWCDKNGFGFFLTSAKTGAGIDEMIDKIVENVVKLNENDNHPTTVILNNSDENCEKSCC